MRELADLSPMLATAGELPPDGRGFGYEFKWDGMRVLVRVEGDRVQAVSRNGNDAAARFPELKGLAKILGKSGAILDGELVVLGEDGRPDFGLMQTRMAQSDAQEIRRSMATHPVQFIAFDALALGTRDLLRAPYVERREVLEGLGLQGSWIVPPFQAEAGSGQVVLEASRDLGLEGVVAKRLDSPYLPGVRSPHWVKVRNRNRQEFVIGGWTEGEGSRSGTVGALLLGVYGSPLGAGKLHYVGRVGSGFKDSDLAVMKRRFKELARTESPFHPFDTEGDKTFFVKPELVCEAEFSGLAHRRVLRQAAFKGMRTDKLALDVVWEQADVSPWTD
ncbi:MAG: non-homologous end-joining DNA ligase [Candidatus Thermoplasmatota archaeon]|jgi:bifunctional non-homologous end joining protein LigD